MLKEILTLVVTALPNWLALVLMGLDRYERWKISNRMERKKRKSPAATGLSSLTPRRPYQG